MEMCAICRNRIADKKNSHIVPSFLTTMVASADHSYKRYKEILYTMTPYVTKCHIGCQVGIEDINRNFSKLTDDDIEEMKGNDAALDNIFCTQCEKLLGECLESPYASTFKDSKKIKPEASFYFWLSVVWRMSEFDFTLHCLSNSLRKKLRGKLARYLHEDVSRSNNKSTSPFSYKILYCRDFCRDNAGMIYLHYNKRYRIASAFFGDFVICLIFIGTFIPKKYKFYGLETHFRQAPLNSGISEEQRMKVSAESLNRAYTKFVAKAQPYMISQEIIQIQQIWKRIRELRDDMPEKPSRHFIQQCIYILHDENIKVGDKCAPNFFIQCFVKAYQLIYGVKLVS